MEKNTKQVLIEIVDIMDDLVFRIANSEKPDKEWYEQKMEYLDLLRKKIMSASQV